MNLCFCGREAKGYYWSKPKDIKPDPKDKVWCCSMKCLDIAFEKEGKIMIDPTDAEISGIIAASEPAGQYIESLGRTDMATWTNDEWMGFLECVITGYTDKMRELASVVLDNEVPF